MAKRRAADAAQVENTATVEKPKMNEAEVFAYQRRIAVLTRAEGEQLVALLDKIGARYYKRGNAALTAIRAEPKQFVIDLTK